MSIRTTGYLITKQSKKRMEAGFLQKSIKFGSVKSARIFDTWIEAFNKTLRHPTWKVREVRCSDFIKY